MTEEKKVYILCTYELFIEAPEEEDLTALSYYVGAHLASMAEQMNNSSDKCRYYSGEIESKYISFGRGKRLFKEAEEE